MCGIPGRCSASSPAPPPVPIAQAPAKPAVRPAGDGLKDAFLAAIEKKRPMVYGTMVAQAQRIDVEGDRIVFRFGPIQTMLGDQVAQQKTWLEELAAELAGRRITVVADVAKGEPGAAAGRAAMRTAVLAEPARDLKAEAMKDPVIQSLLDVIPAEVKDVTELK